MSFNHFHGEDDERLQAGPFSRNSELSQNLDIGMPSTPVIFLA
jgi:hypothetical protein